MKQPDVIQIILNLESGNLDLKPCSPTYQQCSWVNLSGLCLFLKKLVNLFRN